MTRETHYEREARLAGEWEELLNDAESAILREARMSFVDTNPIIALNEASQWLIERVLEERPWATEEINALEIKTLDLVDRAANGELVLEVA